MDSVRRLFNRETTLKQVFPGNDFGFNCHSREVKINRRTTENSLWIEVYVVFDLEMGALSQLPNLITAVKWKFRIEPKLQAGLLRTICEIVPNQDEPEVAQSRLAGTTTVRRRRDGAQIDFAMTPLTIRYPEPGVETETTVVTTRTMSLTGTHDLDGNSVNVTWKFVNHPNGLSEDQQGPPLPCNLRTGMKLVYEYARGPFALEHFGASIKLRTLGLRRTKKATIGSWLGFGASSSYLEFDQAAVSTEEIADETTKVLALDWPPRWLGLAGAFIKLHYEIVNESSPALTT